MKYPLLPFTELIINIARHMRRLDNHEIIIIDDDKDDQEFFDIALRYLKVENPVTYFNDSNAAFEYLTQLKYFPFLIICDINIPGIKGLELKQLMNECKNPKLIAVPFVFITTSASPALLRHASSLNIQGHFHKPTDIDELREIMHRIIKYWDKYYQLSN